MLNFPYPVKFVAANRREFNIRVTKVNKRSWWLQLMGDDNKPIKSIKVSKASIKLRYPLEKGGTVNGPTILRTLLKAQRREFPPTTNNRQASGQLTVG